MALNDTGNQRYDNLGLCTGGLLTANDIGVQKYDWNGLPEGFLGTSISAVTPIRTMLGCGV